MHKQMRIVINIFFVYYIENAIYGGKYENNYQAI